MYLAAYILVYLIGAFFFGDWRNWKKYQGTIMYWIIGDLLYLILTKDKPLVFRK